MSIKNDHELAKAAEQAGILLQQIQDYLQEKNLGAAEYPEAKVRFPRGFIRQAGFQRKRLPFINDNALKDNLAYTLILSDVVLWLKLRTDLWGTPKELLVKLYVFLLATLAESITKEYLTGLCGQNFKKRNEYLFHQEVISEDLKDDLDWLWDTRNRMHLFQLDTREFYNDYDQDCHHRCVRTFRELINALSKKGRITKK